MATVPLLPIPIQLQDSVTSVNMSSGTLEFFLAGTSTPTNLFSDNVATSIGTTITLNSGGYPESGGNVITLFRDSDIALKIVGKNAAGTIFFTADNLEDGLVILASTSNAKGASLVGVEDAGGFFAGADVEAILQDIGATFFKTTRGDIISGTMTFSSASILMADNIISRPVLSDYAIDHSVPTATSTVTFSLIFGNSFVTTLTENVTVTISNPPASGAYGECHIKIIQDGSAGAYTVTWPASVLWPGGTAPVISTGNDAVDSVSLWTIDGGTTWYGNF